MKIFCEVLQAESNRQIFADLCSTNSRNQHFHVLVACSLVQ